MSDSFIERASAIIRDGLEKCPRCGEPFSKSGERPKMGPLQCKACTDKEAAGEIQKASDMEKPMTDALMDTLDIRMREQHEAITAKGGDPGFVHPDQLAQRAKDSYRFRLGMFANRHAPSFAEKPPPPLPTVEEVKPVDVKELPVEQEVVFTVRDLAMLGEKEVELRMENFARRLIDSGVPPARIVKTRFHDLVKGSSYRVHVQPEEPKAVETPPVIDAQIVEQKPQSEEP